MTSLFTAQALLRYFLISKLLKQDLKVALIEKSDLNNITEFNSIDETYGPFKFYKNNNRERVGAFLGTTSLWKQPGVGGKFQIGV